MVRVVFDTNVFVSAFIQPKSPPGQLLAKLIQGDGFELVLSACILDEIRRALRHPKVRKRIKLDDDDLDLRVTMLGLLSTTVTASSDAVSGVSRDADDDAILAAAVEGCADYIVTGDQDLLAIGDYQSIRIVTPRAFLQRLNTP
jgi:putative PIN family toxin of toxin-antitoxin system